MRTKSTLSALLLSLIAVPALHAAGRSTTPLERLVEAHEAAWNRHDGAAMLALFTEDGTLVLPARGERLQGHAELRRVLGVPGPTRQTQTAMKVTAVQWLGDDLALLDVDQTLTGPGTRKVGTRARVVIVARRVDGKWLTAAVRPQPIR